MDASGKYNSNWNAFAIRLTSIESVKRRRRKEKRSASEQKNFMLERHETDLNK